MSECNFIPRAGPNRGVKCTENVISENDKLCRNHYNYLERRRRLNGNSNDTQQQRVFDDIDAIVNNSDGSFNSDEFRGFITTYLENHGYSVRSLDLVRQGDDTDNNREILLNNIIATQFLNAILEEIQIPGEDEEELTTLSPYEFEQVAMSINETDECSICLESKDGLECRLLPCEHSFHDNCARKWFIEQSDCCPLCREYAYT